jgi:acyl carrier protein
MAHPSNPDSGLGWADQRVVFQLANLGYMLESLIKTYLINCAGVAPSIFDRPELRVADLELDSLGLIEMLFEVEDQYGFQVPEPMRYLTMSFAEMVADIEAVVREHNNGQLVPVANIGAAKAND